jgi:nucleotide-binding universal stress UspA family protein
MRPSAYQRILVLLDGNVAGERGLAWARRLAHGPDSVINLLMVEPPARSVREGSRVIAFTDQMEDAARASARAYLEGVAVGLREDGLTVEIHVRIGNPGPMVRAAIGETAADVAVLSPSGPDRLTRDLLLRGAPVPVLVAGPACRRSA